MPPDPKLFQRYADLLEGDTGAALAPLAGQLDALYTALEPPAHLELSVERAVRARLAQASSATGPEGARPRPSYARAHAQTEGRTPVKRTHLQTFAACAAAVAVVALMAALLLGKAGLFPKGQPAGSGGPSSTAAKERLFAQLGGTYAVVQARCPSEQPSCDLSKAIDETIPRLSVRLAAGLNASSVLVERSASDRLLIELAGVRDTAQLAALLNRGAVTFLDTGQIAVPVGSTVGICTTSCHPGQYKIIFTADDVAPNSVSAVLDTQNGQPAVTFAFKGAARTRFADYTRTRIGQYLTIALDNTIIESATIQSEIAGSAEISGLSTPDAAHRIAFYLRFPAPPVELVPQVLRVVAPGTQPASGISCGQGTPPPTPTPQRVGVPTATATTIPPTPAATPVQSNGIQPSSTGASGSDRCSTPTVRPGSTPTPAATSVGTPTPPPTPTPTPGR